MCGDTRLPKKVDCNIPLALLHIVVYSSAPTCVFNFKSLKGKYDVVETF